MAKTETPNPITSPALAALARKRGLVEKVKKPSPLSALERRMNEQARIAGGQTKQRQFDAEVFEHLCEIQCTKDEICNWYGTTDKTLENWIKRTYDGKGFSEVYNEKKGKGRISLRRAQFRMAQKNIAMAIFLGKQWLGQKDSIRQEHTGKNGGPIRTEGDKKPKVDWSKFSVAQLEMIAKIMEQVNPDDDGSRRIGGIDISEPLRITEGKG